MKLNLTASEYRLLLDLVYLGEWMACARLESDEHPRVKKYGPLVQKIYSYAAEAGCGELIERLRESGRLEPTRQFEEDDDLLEVIHEYDQDSFWDELIDRLAERDVRAVTGDGQLPPFKEYLDLAAPIEEKYAREFETHGLGRMQLVTGPEAALDPLRITRSP